jgi:hypothetical protein
MQCSSCLSIFYCTKACRKEDWPEHHSACKQTQKYLHGEWFIGSLFISAKGLHKIEGLTIPISMHYCDFLHYQGAHGFYQHTDFVDGV